MDAGLGESMPAVASQSCRARFTLANDVLLLEVPDGTARLLDMRGNFSVLDGIGAGALGALLSGGHESAVDYLEIHGGMKPHEAANAADTFIAQLRDEAHIVETPCGKAAKKKPSKGAQSNMGKMDRCSSAFGTFVAKNPPRIIHRSSPIDKT
jgi:hypothetical protein